MITSLQNQRVKSIVKLRRRGYRDQRRKMLVEGYFVIQSAVQNQYPLDELYFCPLLFLGNDEFSLIHRVAETGAQVIEVAEEPFRKMAGGRRLGGLLAVAPQIHRSLHGHLVSDGGCYVIAESVESPGNLGSIVRLADGAGADGVVVCDPRADIFDPKAVWASLGTFFSVPILEGSTQQALTWCRENGIRTLAATPHGNVVYTDVDMREAIAIAVGAEHRGLSRLWMEQADVQVRLPLLGQVESLSVTMAATALLYEAVRQRRCGDFLDGRALLPGIRVPFPHSLG